MHISSRAHSECELDESRYPSQEVETLEAATQTIYHENQQLNRQQITLNTEVSHLPCPSCVHDRKAYQLKDFLQDSKDSRSSSDMSIMMSQDT